MGKICVVRLLSWRQGIAAAGALLVAFAVASPSLAQSESSAARSGVAIFWNASKCIGGYHADYYSAHCEAGPAAAILDFNTRSQFECVNNEAVEIRWTIPNWSATDPDRGSPIPPSEVNWSLECWKKPLELDVKPDTMILTPQYSQTPPPNYYMSMNVLLLYDAAKLTIKACLIPFFPGFPVQSACANARIRQ